MKRRSIILSLCLLGGVLLVWWSSRAPARAPLAAATPVAVPENSAGRAGDVNVTEEAMKLAEIQVRPVQLRTVRDRLKVSGAILTGGDQIARVTPRAAGKVVRLLVQVGDPVEAGQTLAILESAELAQVQASYREALAESRALQSNLARQRELARLGRFGRPPLDEARSRAVSLDAGLQRARQRIDEEQAALRQARAEAGVLRAKVARDQELQDLIPRQELERDQADLQKAEAEQVAAQARLRGATAELKLAEQHATIARRALQREEKVYAGRYLTSRELVEAQSAAEMAAVRVQAAAERVELMGGAPGEGSRIVLVSPIRGRVQELSATLGETLGVEDPLCTVINLDKVWARLAISPEDASKVTVGDAVELTAEAAPGQIFRGRVSALDAASDETTRAVYVRAPLANPRGFLKAGTYIHGTLVTDVREQKITVPVGALQEHNGRPTLYVALQGGEFEVRHVLLGTSGEGWREVTDGLHAGEKVATHGTFYLKSEALKSSLSDGCCAGD